MATGSQADAERYRWAIAHEYNAYELAAAVMSHSPVKSETDAAIDAAMAKASK